MQSYTSSDNARIVLNDRSTTYEAAAYIYRTRDPGADFSAREIYNRHSQDLYGERFLGGPINLSFDPVPQWLVLEISNQSHRTDWVLDFGSLSQGQTGITPRFFAINGERGQTLADTTDANAGQMIGRFLPLDIGIGKSMTIVMFIGPSDHAPFAINPRIVRSDALIEARAGNMDDPIKNIVLMFLAGCTVFFVGGMLLRRGMGFFPYALFSAGQFAWYWISGNFIFASLPIALHASGIALDVGALLALALTQSIVISQEGEAGDSILLYICASSVLLAVVLFVFIVPNASIMRIGFAGGAALLGYTMAIFKAFSVKGEMRWAGIAAGFAWLFMLAGQAGSYLGAISGALPSPLLLEAPWLVMPVVATLLMLSGVAYIRASNTMLAREVLRQAQRMQTMSRLKQSKENADQARLLRVIEREREIMEDLRARDAERAEEMRIAKISADEANRAKSAFLAVVSHEIRTPMTGIMGMVRLLLDTQMSKEQRSFTNTIQDSGDAMLALLNDILDFSKIEGGGMALEMVDFDLHRVINGVAMLMNGHATQRNIYLKADIAPGTPRFLRGDPTRLRQVLLNIVGNAIKFTQHGGVTISVRLTEEQNDNPDDYTLYIGITDTGIGISEEAQTNLFNPFSQADSSIARKFGGTGLGLAICKRLIEAMGSEIQLDSVEGQGTTFHFTLTLAKGSEEQAVNAQGGEGANTDDITLPMTLLVVDDNAINRKVMEGLLGRDGHRVRCAASGQEAIDLLAEQPFDLVFMDIEMPEMSGPEAAQIICASDDARVAGTPIVALTGNVSDEDKQAYLDAGMVDSVAKPIDPDKLRQVLLRFGQGQASSDTPQQDTPEMYELSEDELDEDSFSNAIAQPAAQKADQQQNEPENMPKTPPPAHPAVDQNMVASLKGALDKAQLDEMFDGVFEHNSNVLPKLQAAFNEGEREILRASAHELKGMNGNFGLREISELAAEIEHGARTSEVSVDRMDELVFNALPEAMARAQKIIKDENAE